MVDYKAGWIQDSKDNRDYFLDTAISQLPPQEIATDVKNIRLERALLVEDVEENGKPIMRLVPSQEGEKDSSTPYLLLPLAKRENSEGYEGSLGSLKDKNLILPDSIDLKEWFSLIKDQGTGKSCTAHAGVALMEYFQNRMNINFDKESKLNAEEFSWLFVYTLARKLLARRNFNGEELTEKQLLNKIKDSEISIRDTLKVMTLFGVPPEKYWRYHNNPDLSKEPSMFCYAYAQNYRSTHYFRLNRPELKEKERILQIRIAITSGFPAIFGFHFNSDTSTFYDETKDKGEILLSQLSKLNTETFEAGHAVVAVGYDDNKMFGDMKSPGAFLIRNSWDKGWGDNGYGWIPYDCVLENYTTNWWSLLNTKWVDFSMFGLSLKEENNYVILGQANSQYECGITGCLLEGIAHTHRERTS